jgi:hypothetical protein
MKIHKNVLLVNLSVIVLSVLMVSVVMIIVVVPCLIIIVLRDQGWYSQHFIFFVTYECAQEARVFVTGKTFWSSVV